MRALILIFLCSVARGQFLPGVDPSLPEAPPVESLPPVSAESEGFEGGGEIFIERLERIWLESWDEAERVELGGVLSASEGLIVPSPATLEAKLAIWRGKALSEGDLVAIADTILIHYDVEGYPVVGVEVPEQDFLQGLVRFLVEVGRIGKIGVSRPKYGDPTVIRKGLRLKAGEFLRRDELDEQLAWYGRNVFRRPRLFVSPGTEPASADLLIGLEEVKPWRVSVGYENSGPDLLGKNRFLLGAAGMTKNEHVISWQSVVGTPISSLSAHAISWEIPFHRLHQSLQLDAAYAKVLTRGFLNGGVSKNNGSSWSVSAMQKMRLPSLGRWRQRLAMGLEVKATDQFVLFGASSFSPGEVRMMDAKFRYDVDRRWDEGAISLNASLLVSPGGMIPGNHDADFHAYDPRSDSTYVIGRLGAQGWWSPWKDWRLGFRGMAQVSDSHLLPSEQFAIGGYRTVRGLAELEYLGDDGLQGSLELYSPEWLPFRRCQLRFLGFVDHGWVTGGWIGSISATGAGVGVRLRLTEWIDARFDQGWRLDDRGGRSHVGVRFSF